MTEERSRKIGGLMVVGCLGLGIFALGALVIGAAAGLIRVAIDQIAH